MWGARKTIPLAFGLGFMALPTFIARNWLLLPSLLGVSAWIAFAAHNWLYGVCGAVISCVLVYVACSLKLYFSEE